MKFRNTIFLVLCLFAFAIALTGCGSSGGGGGGGGGGKSTCAAPICNSVTGGWTAYETITQSGCQGANIGVQTGPYTYTISQNGSSVSGTVYTGGSFSGSFCGDKMKVLAVYTKNNGTVTANVTMTVNPDCVNFTGTSNWTWYDIYSSDQCSGTTSVTGSKN